MALLVALGPMDASRAAINSVNTVTPGQSRTDGPSEQRLLEVFGLMARGQSREALEKAGKLVADRPNFQLAQLVYGDLLAARMRPLQSVGDMPADMARAGAAPLADLREEAHQRLANLKEKPPEGYVPSQFLKMAPQTRSAMAVDASRSRLYFFENTGAGMQLKADYYVSVGKAGTSKSQEGDQRTPLGVYFVSSHLDRRTLTDFYGIGALTLNYPNMPGLIQSGHSRPHRQYFAAQHANRGGLPTGLEITETTRRTCGSICRVLRELAPGQGVRGFEKNPQLLHAGFFQLWKDIGSI